MSAATGEEGYLFLAGAARSGTTALANVLSAHPDVITPSVKEPNFFSTKWEFGLKWYDSLFPKRSPNQVRMDASANYTYPQYREALGRISRAIPRVTVVFTVREPISRAYSQFCHEEYFLAGRNESKFLDSVGPCSKFLAPSDYDAVLRSLREFFDDNALLVVPSESVRRDPLEVATQVWRAAGLDPALARAVDLDELHRNELRVMRSRALRWAFDAVRETKVYPRFRRLFGEDRTRRVRAALTKPSPVPRVEDVLASASETQLGLLNDLACRAQKATARSVEAQDMRLGSDWLNDASWLTSGYSLGPLSVP